jgi:hypothetical protein
LRRYDMTVWAVVYYSGHDTCVVELFTTKELALAYLASLPSTMHMGIEEYKVLSELPPKQA